MEKMMIAVRTGREKRALAAALAVHDPDFLADLKMITECFGKTVAVHYRNDDPDVQAAVEKDFRELLQRGREK